MSVIGLVQSHYHEGSPGSLPYLIFPQVMFLHASDSYDYRVLRLRYYAMTMSFCLFVCQFSSVEFVTLLKQNVLRSCRLA